MAFIQYITQIHLDFGAVRLLPAELRRIGARKPLVVTDIGVRAAGVLDKALAALLHPSDGSAPVAHHVFDQTPSNPTEAAVRRAVQALEDSGCDSVVAVGGGSSIDLAKAVAIAAVHPGPLATYATIEGGSGRITDQALPVIAVPTTAGTGSEVARGAIVIVDDGRKLGFHSWNIVPRSAICDPELTLKLPAGLTAATGMDAIAHCIETYLAAAVNPPADSIALDGLKRGWEHIERATRNPNDREARWQMMSASMQGAMAFQKGLGCVHSLSHSLGGLNPKLHHGTLNAMFLPAVVRFNATADTVAHDKRITRLGEAMGLATIDPAGVRVAEAIQYLNARLSLPSGLGAMGVARGDFDAIIDGALADHCHKTNPRLATREEYREMLAASM
jgi:4-hydroxybutyrate dehydrogenase